MTAIEHIKAAEQVKLVDEDGESVTLELAPPLTIEQIDSLQKQAGQPLPEELRSLLQFCSGINGFLCEIDFSGRSMSYAQNEIFPNGLPIAADGFGNYWVLDLTPQTTQIAPVFFACHDAPVILYQNDNLASFLVEMFRMAIPPNQSLVDDVHEDRLFNVWRTNPGIIDQPTASGSADSMIRSFAEQLPEYFHVVDLRYVKPGMGFSWGRYGPRTEVRRYGYERIFGYGKPISIDNGKPRSKGFWTKLFGR